MPRMSPQTSVYTTSPLDFDELVASLEEKDDYWLDVIGCYNDAFVRRNNIPDIEERILKGIPDSLRGAVYARVLQIKTSVDKGTYANLLKSASGAKTDDAEIPLDKVDEDAYELLRVFEFCIRESAPIAHQESRHRTYHFIAGLTPLLQKHSGLENHDVLSLLFRFAELYQRFPIDEFAYKGSRALEDVAKDQFLQIVTQGINIEELMKKFLAEFYVLLSDDAVKLKVLDFIVFEGFDSLIRLIVAQFVLQEREITAKNGTELAKYLLREGLFSSMDMQTLQEWIKIEFPLIVYENEYHLMNANAISSNDQELSNLKEVYDDLVTKKNEMIEKLSSLRKTHSEIQSQNDDFKDQLEKAEGERTKLTEMFSDLQERYSRLTMQENLQNTVKANEDISKSNSELELQINELEAAVEKKKAKLAKHAR